MYKYSFILFILWLSANRLYAQNFKLALRGNDEKLFQTIYPLPLNYASFIECKEALSKAQLQLIKQGYLTASFDSLSWNDTLATAFIYVGKKYAWAKIRNDNIPSSLLTQSRFDEKKLFNKPIEVKQFYPVFEKIIRYFEDNGYPFASVYLDSIQIVDQLVSASLHLAKGPLTRIDTILLNEDAKVSKQFLLQYLGLKQGMLYNESKIKNISNRIRELSFLQESYPWRIDFNVVETKLSIYTKNKSANRADVLIGLLPNNEERGGKFLLTGDVKLAFINALGYGENLSINWQNLQYQSPRYNVQFQWPYIAKSPIGLSGKFDFYKKDTTFKNVNGELGLLYQFNANDQLKFYYELASSRLLSVNTSALIINRRLPENSDVRYRTFGFETILSRVDYKLNPRKGYSISLNAGLSFRNLIKNTSVENTFDPIRNESFAYLYDNLKLKNYKYSFKVQLAYYLPLQKRLILAGIYNSGLALSSEGLYRNELFQIGGYRLLRGFDEGSLFVNNYQVLSIEPRYLLSLNSYVFIFSDVGYIQAKYSNINRRELAYSSGLGMTFETKAGLFNLSYAIGARKDQAFQFKNSKIHFGYISFF